eukprot:scaffold2586_cov46-Attheya_sp.AAC.1
MGNGRRGRWIGQWRVWGMRVFGLDIRGCSLGVAFGGPGVVRDAGAMAGFVVLAGRWFHRRKVGRN